MTKDDRALIADHNKKAGLVLGSIFFCCFLFNFTNFIMAAIIRSESPSISLLMIMAGTFGFGLFGWLSLWYFLAVLQNNPALVITRDGIYDHSEPWSPGLIPWSEIKEIHKRQILFWRVMVITLHNRDGVIARQKNIFKRNLFKKGWSPINLPDEVCVRLNTITEPILAVLLDRLGQNTKNNPSLYE